MNDATTAAGTAPGADDTGGDERLAYRGPIQRLLTRPEIGALLGAVAVWMIFWLVSGQFGTAGGTANFLDVAATLGLMAVPVALLMIGGEFDLSSGSMTGATAIMVILLSKEVGPFGGAGLTLHLAVPLALAFALAIGWFNGTVVERTSLPSFIVTLGTFFILIGGKLAFAKLFTDKVIVEGLDENKGYDFWDGIFGAEWIRNAHVWDFRDWAWTFGLVFGAVAILLGLFELSYVRRAQADTSGMAVFLAGLSLGILGFVLMLTRDGGDLLWGIMIGAGILGGTAGWCRWRYEPAHHITGSLDPAVARLVGTGVGAALIGIFAAVIMDSTNSDQLGFVTGDGSRFLLFLGIGVAGVLAAAVAAGRAPEWAPVIGVGIVAISAVSFLVTIQATRAILLVVAVVVALLAFNRAAALARESDGRTGFAVAMLTPIALVVVAFVIRGEAESRKIGIELFGLILLVAAILASHAISRLIAEPGDTDHESPTFGRVRQAAVVAAVAGAVVFTVIEMPDLTANTVLYPFATGIAKGAILGIAVLGIGAALLAVVARDTAAGRALVPVGVASMGLGLAARLMFMTEVEVMTDNRVTRFRVIILFYMILAGVGTWLLARTQFGNWTFAVGGNAQAARSVGVPAARTKTSLFMMVSGTAWLTGMLIAFRLNSVQANVGDGLEFRYIIVAVVGGCLLTGGYGSALGAAIGALIWGMITQGIGFASWNTDWRFLVLGGLLLIAVIVNNYVRQQAEKAR